MALSQSPQVPSPLSHSDDAQCRLQALPGHWSCPRVACVRDALVLHPPLRQTQSLADTVCGRQRHVTLLRGKCYPRGVSHAGESRAVPRDAYALNLRPAACPGVLCQTWSSQLSLLNQILGSLVCLLQVVSQVQLLLRLAAGVQAWNLPTASGSCHCCAPETGDTLSASLRYNNNEVLEAVGE